uniref:Uncharacterized protein MANES_12G120100 n=1 Tax=Rhizophora mucronata TaxID=61149 RepID=A0A2P2IRD1_RHIMU
MQGEDLTLRHEIMHNTEQTLLHFPGILCAKGDHFPSSKIQIYASRGCHVVSITITWEHASIVYSEVRSTKILQLFWSGSDTPATHPIIQLYTLRSYAMHISYHVPPLQRGTIFNTHHSIIKITSTIKGTYLAGLYGCDREEQTK